MPTKTYTTPAAADIAKSLDEVLRLHAELGIGLKGMSEGTEYLNRLLRVAVAILRNLFPTPILAAQIINEVGSYRKISCIRVIRALCGISLREAYQAYETSIAESKEIDAALAE